MNTARNTHRDTARDAHLEALRAEKSGHTTLARAARERALDAARAARRPPTTPIGYPR